MGIATIHEVRTIRNTESYPLCLRREAMAPSLTSTGSVGLRRLDEKKKNKKSNLTEDKSERAAEIAYRKGLACDIVFTYPKGDQQHQPREILEKRVQAILAMRAVGLLCVKQASEDGTTMFLKVSGKPERLETEADRIGIEMLIKSDRKGPPIYRDFTRDNKVGEESAVAPVAPVEWAECPACTAQQV